MHGIDEVLNSEFDKERFVGKAILIDPMDRSITEIMVEPSRFRHQQICRILGARVLHSEDIYGDNERLVLDAGAEYKETKAFTFDGVRCEGKGLILGMYSIDDASTRLTVEYIMGRVAFPYIRGIFIDPKNKTVTEFKLNDDPEGLDGVKHIIDFTIDHADEKFSNGDILLINEFALNRKPLYFFEFDGSPYAGKALVMGYGKQEQSGYIDAASTLEDIVKRVTFP